VQLTLHTLHCSLQVLAAGVFVCASLYWRHYISLLLLLLTLLLVHAGVGAGSTDVRTMQLSGVAGLLAGALSMACGA
jgi:hypothetical protein